MICPHCQAPELRKLNQTTDLGYSEFRCGRCRRKSNERTGTPFNFLELATDIVFEIVLCRLRYSSVCEIWPNASQLQPHRIRTFTFSPAPDFEPKLLDIVGLYLNPPENALVLCVDEKPGIQALDRTQPLLPLRAKKPQSWTNEYVRHGTQTMIAALEIATGKVVLTFVTGAPR